MLLQGNFPNPGIKLGSPALQAGSSLSESPGKLLFRITVNRMKAHQSCAGLLRSGPAPPSQGALCSETGMREKDSWQHGPIRQSRTFNRKRIFFPAGCK